VNAKARLSTLLKDTISPPATQLIIPETMPPTPTSPTPQSNADSGATQPGAPVKKPRTGARHTPTPNDQDRAPMVRELFANGLV